MIPAIKLGMLPDDPLSALFPHSFHQPLPLYTITSLSIMLAISCPHSHDLFSRWLSGIALHNRTGHAPSDASANESMAVGIQHPIPASATSPKYQSYHVTTTKKSELSVASTVGDGHLDDFTTTAAAAATAAFVAAAAKAAYPDQHAEMGPGNGAVDVGELVQPAAMYAAPETKLDKPVFVGSISDQLKAVLAMIDVDECDVDGEGAFFVADLAEVYRQHLRWVKELPRIVPFYGEQRVVSPELWYT